MIKHLTLFAAVAFAATSHADLNAFGFITYTQSGSNYTYDITLRNTGDTTIGTLWYAWIPGQDYLPLPPTSTSSSAGWTLTATTSAGYGTGLRWVAPAGALLQPGHSLSGFRFTTTATPTELAGDSIFPSHNPVGTTFVYHAGPFSDAGKRILVNPVPEPTSVLALAGGLAAFVRRRRAR